MIKQSKFNEFKNNNSALSKDPITAEQQIITWALQNDYPSKKISQYIGKYGGFYYIKYDILISNLDDECFNFIFDISNVKVDIYRTQAQNIIKELKKTSDKAKIARWVQILKKMLDAYKESLPGGSIMNSTNYEEDRGILDNSFIGALEAGLYEVADYIITKNLLYAGKYYDVEAGHFIRLVRGRCSLANIKYIVETHYCKDLNLNNIATAILKESANLDVKAYGNTLSSSKTGS